MQSVCLRRKWQISHQPFGQWTGLVWPGITIIRSTLSLPAGDLLTKTRSLKLTPYLVIDVRNRWFYFHKFSGGWWTLSLSPSNTQVCVHAQHTHTQNMHTRAHTHVPRTPTHTHSCRSRTREEGLRGGGLCVCVCVCVCAHASEWVCEWVNE